MRVARMLPIIAGLLALPAATRPSPRAASRVIPLIAFTDTRTDSLWGMSNVFFEPSAGMPTPATVHTARDVQTALIIDRPEAHLRALRWREADSTWQYAVDTDADGDFSRETPLAFRRAANANGQVWMADFVVRIKARDVRLQFVYVDNYTYVRPRETYIGVWEERGERFTVRIRPRNRSGAVGLSSDEVEVAIDLDRDGAFRIRRDSSTSAIRTVKEDVGNAPFRLGTRAWRVTSVTATALTLTTVDTSTSAVSEGFIAPQLAVRMFGTNRIVDVARAAGDSLTVIEMWSVDCPFSERSRPVLNALHAELATTRVRWFSIPREREATSIEKSLTAHPRSLPVATVTADDWARYNPMTITPTWIVIDARAKIVLHETGADRLSLVRAAIHRLRR
jgi:hypothetical protein